MSHALSALHNMLIRWIHQLRPVRRPMANDRVDGVLPPANLPTAHYDPVGLTFTCPHCGQRLLIAEWTLIETGYERYWSLEPHNADIIGIERVTAIDDRFSDNGDDAPARLVHESHGCYRVSLVPENFEWDWN